MAWSKPLWLLSSALGYVVTFALVSMALQRGWTMALTYGLWAAGGIMLLAVADRLLLGETLRGTAVVGMVLSIAGIALMLHGTGAGHAPAPRPSSARAALDVRTSGVTNG